VSKPSPKHIRSRKSRKDSEKVESLKNHYRAPGRSFTACGRIDVVAGPGPVTCAVCRYALKTTAPQTKALPRIRGAA
jgi:hypothetical protein